MEYAGNYQGAGKRFAIVASRFNSSIVDRLIEGALDCLHRHDVGEDAVDIAKVPGAFEIPLAAKKLASLGSYDVIICLGAVVRGETPHFDYVANEVSKGIACVSLEFSLPVVFGVLTTDTYDQALDRAGGKAGNKGWEAALAGIEMANLLNSI